MPQFWLGIHGDDLLGAMMRLNGASIPIIGIFQAWDGDEPPADLKLFRLTAAVDASSEEAARTRVKTA